MGFKDREFTTVFTRAGIAAAVMVTALYVGWNKTRLAGYLPPGSRAYDACVTLVAEAVPDANITEVVKARSGDGWAISFQMADADYAPIGRYQCTSGPSGETPRLDLSQPDDALRPP